MQFWPVICSITNHWKIYRYHEKSLQQRLEILYQRNLFVYAISLAQKSSMEPQQQNAIYRKYGDFLYQKAEYDSAMQQYLKAIDNTEPSQVIRKVNTRVILERSFTNQISISTRNGYII
jgi:hypothetical protein